MSYVYKITYPNGKIYIGQDVTGSFMTYFGSGNRDYIQKDFTWEQMQNFSIQKEILWVQENPTPVEITEKETELIVKYEANNPEKGYNLIPKNILKS
jgi:hypothetical protein